MGVGISAQSGDQILILGAGPSGLGTALGIAMHGGDVRTTLVEKNDRPGGLSGSYRWKDHTIDFGPHRLSPNLENVRVLANELLGPDCLVKRSQHGVFFSGKLYQFPPRVRDWFAPKSFFLAVVFGWSFFASKITWIMKRFSGDTFQTVVTRKFGGLFYRYIAGPMAEKVWTNPNDIDPSFVNQRFSLVHPKEVIKKYLVPKQELNPSQFYYPRLGYQQLWDRMAERIRSEGQGVFYESTVKEITVENDRITKVVITTPMGERTFEGEGLQVVSTIPIFPFVGALNGCETGAMKQRLAQVKIRSMLLVAFEFDQPKTLPFRTLIFPEKRVQFNRLFEQNEYSRETVCEGKSVIVADITVPRGDDRLKESDEEIIASVRKDLEKLYFIDSARISDAKVERVEFAYVVPDVQTRSAFFEIDHQLKSISNLTMLGRFSVGEYDNSDYAIDHGMSLGAMLTGRTSKLDYLRKLHHLRGRVIVG